MAEPRNEPVLENDNQNVPSIYEQQTGALALQNGGNGDDPQQSFELFSTRRPKDFKAGLSSGLKNIGKGIGAGLATAIAAPIAGARQEGLAGFGKGLGLGLVAAVALPLAGVGTGLFQISRGVFNTPEAIHKAAENQEWDPKTRQWYGYNLQQEAEHILKMSDADFIAAQQAAAAGNDEQKTDAAATASQSKPQHTRPVKDTAFYDLLGVDTNASLPELKRAYYQKARVCHPDRHPEDPEKYHQLFQELSAAYQVLSDPQLREKYDKGGPDGMEEISTLESTAFFQIMFGSEKFDYYVGELRLTQMMNTGMDAMQKMQDMDAKDVEDMSEAELLAREGSGLFGSDAAQQFRQLKREVQCAVNLASTLQGFIDDPQSFKAKLEQEATELSTNVIGATLLKVIAYVYMEQAEKMLGFKHSVGAGLGFTEMKRKGHVVVTKYRVVKSAYQAYKSARKLDEMEQAKKKSHSQLDMDEKGDDAAAEAKNENEHKQELNINEEDNMNQMLDEDMAKPMMGMVETLWNYSVIDIESTLRAACRKLDKDLSVSAKVREQRARGLYEMGQILSAKGVTADQGLRAFEEQMKDGIQMKQNIDKHAKEQEQEEQHLE